jgi:hypothetical protein
MVASFAVAPAWVPALAAPDAQAGPPPPPPPPARPGLGRAGAALDLQRGVFATVCDYSHQAPDDPIVKPNQPGTSHLHQFFGNATTDAATTYDSLRAGGTTCRASEDGSGYWVPALYKDGAEVQPTFMNVYYRAARHDPGSIQAFPAGFRVVAGDAMATSAQGQRVTGWVCQGIPGPSETPPTCPANAPLTMHAEFPDCWDGVSTDSPDHKSHTAYGRLGVCPADHPVALPSLTLIVHYPITGDPGVVTLSSGSVYSGHADFFNAWDQNFLASKVDGCLNATIQCGVVADRPMRPLRQRP